MGFSSNCTTVFGLSLKPADILQVRQKPGVWYIVFAWRRYIIFFVLYYSSIKQYKGHESTRNIAHFMHLSVAKHCGCVQYRSVCKTVSILNAACIFRPCQPLAFGRDRTRRLHSIPFKCSVFKIAVEIKNKYNVIRSYWSSLLFDWSPSIS